MSTVRNRWIHKRALALYALNPNTPWGTCYLNAAFEWDARFARLVLVKGGAES